MNYLQDLFFFLLYEGIYYFILYQEMENTKKTLFIYI